MKANASKPPIRIGLCGFGTVGQGVYKHLQQRAADLASRLGAGFEITAVAVRDPSKKREVSPPADCVSNDPLSIAADPSVQIVCELMGGPTTEAARAVVLAALERGKIVVTANKALLCEHGAEVFAAARKGGGHVFFEASVAGGIPIIKVVREGLVANRFHRIYGILNGTCNYILTRMEREGGSYEEILADAKRLGYAEADESLDVDGWDTAHKASILAFLAHGRWVGTSEMRVEGIRRLSQADIAFARAFDYRIKLLAVIDRNFKTGDLAVSVRPTLVPSRLVLANVNEVYNGVCVIGDVVGTTLYIGRGAGQDATASAVISDIVDAISVLSGDRRPLIPDEAPSIVEGGAGVKIAPPKSVLGRYYLRLTVRDQPGVLAQVANVMATNNVSIASVLQRESPIERAATLILTTHDTNEKAIQQTVLGLKSSPSVMDEPVLLSIADFED
ncbi:MAG: homoserine dehydrogenase [Opitutaceae bacterium]